MVLRIVQNHYVINECLLRKLENRPRVWEYFVNISDLQRVPSSQEPTAKYVDPFLLRRHRRERIGANYSALH